MSLVCLWLKVEILLVLFTPLCLAGTAALFGCVSDRMRMAAARARR